VDIFYPSAGTVVSKEGVFSTATNRCHSALTETPSPIAPGQHHLAVRCRSGTSRHRCCVTHFDRNVIVDTRATSSLNRYASSDGVHVQAKRLFCQNDAVEVGCRRTLPHQSPLVLVPNTSRGFRVGHSHPAIRWGVHTSSIHTCKRRYCATLLEAVMEACMQAPELSGASMTHAIELRRSE
jgi:hypothetical protein